VLVLWLGVAALARRRWIAMHSVDVSRMLLTLSVMAGLHVGRITGALVGVFLAAAFGGALAEARRLSQTGELSQGLEQLLTLPPPMPPPLPPPPIPSIVPPLEPPLAAPRPGSRIVSRRQGRREPPQAAP